VNVLVTGGGGFLGAALCTRFADEPVALRVHTGPAQTPLSSPVPGVPTLACDITDEAALAEFAAGIDVLVHMAGPAAVAESFVEPARYVHCHAVGTATIARVCERAGVRKLVYISSAEVYGSAASSPVSESAPLAPRSPYAAAKAAAEYIVSAAARARSLDAVIMRPFSIYGPRMRRNGVLGSIIDQAVRGPIRLADLRPVRDYCYIDDLVSAVLKACASSAAAEPRIYNVGTGAGVSVEALAHAALAVCGRSATVSQLDRADRPAAADISHLVADSSAIRRDLGWQPQVNLAEGLKRTLAWWRVSSGAPS
jgi:nucleoside-diphosphate-sugar epimerase